MEPRMLSEQFNKPVDGTTNFDSPSGITCYWVVKFITTKGIWECARFLKDGKSHKGVWEVTMTTLSVATGTRHCHTEYLSEKIKYLPLLTSKVSEQQQEQNGLTSTGKL